MTAPPRPPAPRPPREVLPAARDLKPREELEVLIRARYPLIYVVSWEEERVERCLRQIAQARNKKLFVWTITQGLVRSGAEAQRSRAGSNNTSDPIAALDAVVDQVDPAIFLFKDFHHFTSEERCNLTVHRRLRDVALHLRDTYKSLIIVAPKMQISQDLAKDVSIIEFDLPGPGEFGRLLDRIVEDVRENPQVQISLDVESRERLLHAARGLTLKEAENVFAKTLVLDGRLDGDDVSVVVEEKQQIIKKSGLLEFYSATEEIDNVAGLENLKDWLRKRSIAFTERAAKFGLPSPRGVLLLGVQGCGKSLCAKAAASLWKLPLLRFDVGRMFSSLVGSSEQNIRQALQVAESIAPVVLWIDEIDKALAGATSSSGSDGGTASRVFGTLLTWLSEKTAPVFVIATANDISQLPPELLRKGRLDEIFFVDLPNEIERRAIFQIQLRRRGRQMSENDLQLLAQSSDGFSGAEIEEAIISSLFDALSCDQDVSVDVIRRNIAETVPLSRTMSEEISRLRSWAGSRARPASGSLQRVVEESRRKIELE
ncbi:AAA family ATPase [Planctellipticum variicoloris]|uniref:AAA family ATPase n=1 Tax=Planctellipticum variicoloris TaxID=3064265 RepID=UPI002CCDB053|nr:AAA family ATPase [Planctomycetaceae bacterium SH412]HTN02994.1 AAA family ATPase [Planctomycetaceae bacterium]